MMATQSETVKREQVPSSDCLTSELDGITFNFSTATFCNLIPKQDSFFRHGTPVTFSKE